jgi:hypothetical protein
MHHHLDGLDVSMTVANIVERWCDLLAVIAT